MKKIWTTFLLTLVWYLLSPACLVGMETQELLTIGSKAPAIDVEHWISKGNGRFDKVTDFEKGKVYIIEFWATWCGPCIASMPHLVDLQQRFADRGVQLISISDEELEVVEKFLQRPVRGSPDEELTFGKLTSAYCLTTDPDRSVFTDYMEAAGQNEIPRAFIVGKGGMIEWIGHPMGMEEPLEQILNDSWDREVARSELIASQRRGLLMTNISRAMQTGDYEQALGIIDQAIEEYAEDIELMEFLSSIRIRVQVFPATRLAMEGKINESLAVLNDLKKEAPDHVQDIVEVELTVLLHGERHDEAAKVLNQVTADEEDAIKLTQIAMMILESSKGSDDFSKPLLASATAAAKRASELTPGESSMLDTYARLLHRCGKLDEALDVQRQAAELAGDSDSDIQEFLEELKKEKESAGE